MRIHFFTAPFYFAFIWFRVQGSGFRWRLRRKYTYDDTRSPSFAETNPASLRSSAPSRGRGANDFSGNTDSIVVFRGHGLALPPHMLRTSPLSSSVFHTACALSAPAGHLPLEGKAGDTRIPSSKKATKPPPYNKAPSTSVGMIGGRRVISHSLSHRFVDPSCAFGAPLL